MTVAADKDSCNKCPSLLPTRLGNKASFLRVWQVTILKINLFIYSHITVYFPLCLSIMYYLPLMFLRALDSNELDRDGREQMQQNWK